MAQAVVEGRNSALFFLFDIQTIVDSMQIGLSDATTTERAIRKSKQYTIFDVCVCVERETVNKTECSLFLMCGKCQRV